MSYNNGPRIVTNGLSLLLDAGNNKSYPGTGTSWFDLSGNNYHGSLINGPTYTSANKGAITFDGTNDTATSNIGSLLKTVGSGDFAISVWFNSTKSSRGDLFSWKSSDGTYDIGIILNGSSNGTMQLYYKTPSGGVGFYTAFQYVSNIPNCIHFQKKTGFVETYLNGVLKHSTSAGGDVTNHPETLLYIASNRGILPFAGNIFNLSVYNLSLSNSQILQNYNEIKGRFNI